MEKEVLRQKYTEMRKALSENQIIEQSIAIANQLLELPIWEKSFFHIFLTIERHREVDTSPILTLLQGRYKNIVISNCDFVTKSMRHSLLTDDTRISVSEYDIPEPVEGLSVDNSQIDVIFVPLLAYDSGGQRIGYGMGFYDRFLSKCRKDVMKIGLSFFPPEKRINDAEKTDILLDIVVTPCKVYRF